MKKFYVAPVVEAMSCKVEKGFATSFIGAGSNNSPLETLSNETINSSIFGEV